MITQSKHTTLMDERGSTLLGYIWDSYPYLDFSVDADSDGLAATVQEVPTGLKPERSIDHERNEYQLPPPHSNKLTNTFKLPWINILVNEAYKIYKSRKTKCPWSFTNWPKIKEAVTFEHICFELSPNVETHERTTNHKCDMSNTSIWHGGTFTT